MNNKKLLSALFPIALAVCQTSACSTTSSERIASTGPTILDAKANPATFELTRDLQPNSDSRVVATVKDFQGDVTNVKLRFLHVPLELPMKRINGSTWETKLSDQQLKQLAVSGHTMKYDANVVATNDKGQVSVSKDPVQISIKAPEIQSG